MAKPPSLAKTRSLARRRAMQAIYQWQMTGDDALVIKKQFMENQDMSKTDIDYFTELINGVSNNHAKLDAALEKVTDRQYCDVDHVEKAILRLAAYELDQRHDVPYRVVLNEAINLAKKFGSDESHAFVNGALDKLLASMRTEELKPVH